MKFTRKLEKPIRTQETTAEYKTMSKIKQGNVKDVGGFVGGYLKDGIRKSINVESRSLITLDIDSITANVDIWENFKTAINHAAVMYSTHSHTKEAPRFRIIMPLSRAVTSDEYSAISRLIAADIGIEYFDDTTYEPSRLMYWPSIPADGKYIFEYLDATWIDADKQLARFRDWRNCAEWPHSSRITELHKKSAKAQGDPHAKDSIIGAFCRVYSIEDAIEKYIPDVYSRGENETRYSYMGGSTTGGLIIYDEGKFAYSHHATDPASERLCNAFDLIRIHKFREMDEDVKPGTPAGKFPSYQAMKSLALNDSAVKDEFIREKFDDDFDENPAKLQLDAKGKVVNTIDNIVLILTNDKKLKNKYYYDEFKDKFTLNGDLPWMKFNERMSNSWTDADDAGLRAYIEKVYKIYSIRKILDAVEIAMQMEKRHPIRDYLNGLVWDGAERADTLFIDYLGAEDSLYTREVTRKAFIGAAARIYEPGCKHDHTLVLVGPQGCFKSTTIAKLGKGWYSDSLYTVVGKDAYEQLQGAWIIEIGEMAAMRKAELEQMKHFISKQSDSYRAAYAHKSEEHPRQCAFFGTTNDEEFLRDSTGARRFWPVEVSMRGQELGAGLTPEIVDQVWAEIVSHYKAGENWYLIAGTKNAAEIIQDEFTERNVKQGLIEDFLEIPLPDNWEAMSLDERRLYFNGGFNDTPCGGSVRMKVCALEIWQELFYSIPAAFTQTQAREINNILRRIKGWKSKPLVSCGKMYGRQRGFIRDVFDLILE
jgi:hypothetical protein